MDWRWIEGDLFFQFLEKMPGRRSAGPLPRSVNMPLVYRNDCLGGCLLTWLSRRVYEPHPHPHMHMSCVHIYRHVGLHVCAMVLA